jgi:hypothetical protein
MSSQELPRFDAQAARRVLTEMMSDTAIDQSMFKVNALKVEKYYRESLTSTKTRIQHELHLGQVSSALHHVFALESQTVKVLDKAAVLRVDLHHHLTKLKFVYVPAVEPEATQETIRVVRKAEQQIPHLQEFLAAVDTHLQILGDICIQVFDLTKEVCADIRRAALDNTPSQTVSLTPALRTALCKHIGLEDPEEFCRAFLK